MTLSACTCGIALIYHDQPLVLLHHDKEMHRLTIERLRKRLSSIGVLDGMPWFRVDSALTDEEVGR